MAERGGDLSWGDQAEPLVDREREHAEHEMGHHFNGAAHANVVGSELVFQPAIDALTHGAYFVPFLLGPS